MGRSVVRGVAGSRLGVRLRVVRRTHPLKRRTGLQVGRSQLAARLRARRKSAWKSVTARCGDSRAGRGGERRVGLEGSCTSEEGREQTGERVPLRDSRGSSVTAGAAAEAGEWESLHTPPPVVRALEELGFTAPTAIQRKAIPPAIVEGCDIVGAAETGSGKTLAFAIPILHYVLHHCMSSNGGGKKQQRWRSRGRHKGGEGRRTVDLNRVIHGGKGGEEEEQEEEEERGEVVEEEEAEEEEEITDEDLSVESDPRSEDVSDLEVDRSKFMKDHSGDRGEGDAGGGTSMGLVGYRDNIPDEDFERMLAGLISPWDKAEQSHDLASRSHHDDDITPMSHDSIADEHVSYNGDLVALILTPTRELALQVQSHICTAAKHTAIKVCAVVGGMAVERQERLLRQLPPIVVGTPGRLWKLMQEGDPHLCCLDNLRFLVLDEADRMVEFGHYQELGNILDRVNGAKGAESRQSLVFSATLALPRDSTEKRRRRRKKMTGKECLDNLISRVGLHDGMRVVDLTQKKGTVTTLTETKITCSTPEKDVFLYHFLLTHPGRTLVFVNSIGQLQHVRSLLELLCFKPHPLHARMQQKQRLKNLERFISDPCGLLIASDVAARGLDIPHVEHVIHYQVPRNTELYVHRSGRTARARLEGLSVLLVAPEDLQAYRNIRRTLNRDKELPTFPLDPTYLSPLRVRVRLAKQILSVVQRGKRVRQGNEWAIQAAQAMEIEVDEDMLEEEPAMGGREQVKLQEMKAELASLLRSPVLPHTLCRTYPTCGGNHKLLAGLQEGGPKIVVSKETDALTVAKQHRTT